MIVLIANAGSTSFKFRLFDMPAERPLAEGRIEDIGSGRSPVQFSAGDAPATRDERDIPDYRRAVEAVLRFLTADVLSGLDELDAVGFKTVHGRGMRSCTLLTHQVLDAMRAYNFLAPAHNPPYITAIRTFEELAPEVPRVGLFEPAFHVTMPDYASVYGVPYDWREKYGIQRYGFHGASHRYVSQRVPGMLEREGDDLRIISCHLGGSSSICAIRDGCSIDTSMGFSPQSGVLNGTRNGDLDPFVALYLIEEQGMSPTDVADALCQRSGLAGISGVSANMKEIEEEAAAGNQRAQLAIDAFCYGIRKYIGAYYAALEGLDVLAFTGGIGERSATIRRRVCDPLKFMGVRLDEIANDALAGVGVISNAGSDVTIAVVQANEEIVVAREVYGLLTA